MRKAIFPIVAGVFVGTMVLGGAGPAGGAPEDVTLTATPRGHALDVVITNHHFNKAGCAIWIYRDPKQPTQSRTNYEHVVGFNPIPPGQQHVVIWPAEMQDGDYHLYWECAGILDVPTSEGNGDGHKWGTSPFLLANEATTAPIVFSIPGPDGPDPGTPTTEPTPTTTTAPPTSEPDQCFSSVCLPAGN